MASLKQGIVRVFGFCLVVAACTAGPLGESIGCACAEEYFAFADIDRWKAAAARNDFREAEELARYYRLKGWHDQNYQLFRRRLLARDPVALAEEARIEELEREAKTNNIQAVSKLSDHLSQIGRIDEAKALSEKLIELGDEYALDNRASRLFNEATSLPDGDPKKLERLYLALSLRKRMGREVSAMDAVTLRGSGLAHLLRPGERAVASRILVEREIKRLEP